ncbi:unnamed protein product [Mytilus coruscus]|uniref:Ig-like domain-containing protein n=1 Tax=Mytilus coruscus TaxID=42192 RepID=A0A6J8F3Z6_MYTCO|nr:unnamed protein product [Mytilus coruscus]
MNADEDHRASKQTNDTMRQTATLKPEDYKCILYVPNVEVEVREQTAHFGEELSIQCTVQSDPVHGKVYWEKRNGDEVTSLTSQTKGIRGITIDQPSLTIMFVASTDTGSYTCYAQNSVGVGKSKTTKLNVVAGAPVVNIGSVFYTTVFGVQITLECAVIVDPPVRYVFWHKNINGYLTSIIHVAVGTQGISPTSSSLTIVFPGKSDQGEYICIAVNDLGKRRSLPTLLSVSGDSPRSTNHIALQNIGGCSDS